MKPVPVRTLYSIPCADVGVGMTCRSILRAAAISGYQTDLFTSRAKWIDDEPFLVRKTVPSFLGRVPYRAFRPVLDALTHRRFLAAVQEGDIAYLWPSAPLDVFESLTARGIPIAVEVVNSVMSVAKPILDAAYDGLGLPPTHGITDALVADQARRFALCSAIFIPNQASEDALAATPMFDRVIGSSYGTWVPRTLPQRAVRVPGAPVTFVFVGAAGVRKGVHLLLDAWRDAPPMAQLRIVGPVQPAIKALFADVLNRPDVSCAGYVRDVTAEFYQADVAILPSLEEGDPIATYEAAAHGLPVLASPAGAGRIGATTDAIDVFDPADKSMFAAKIAEYAASEELRRHKGHIARQAAQVFDWAAVGKRRFTRLMDHLGK